MIIGPVLCEFLRKNTRCPEHWRSDNDCTNQRPLTDQGREEACAVRGGPVKEWDTERHADLKKLLATLFKPGANLVIASHGNPFYAVAGPPYLAAGETAAVPPAKGFRDHHTREAQRLAR